jgi:hypothetical protein
VVVHALQDEIVLVTTERPDGTCARIVFRNGGFDDAAKLEQLCEKVGVAHVNCGGRGAAFAMTELTPC